jgi:hypothetical protein
MKHTHLGSPAPRLRNLARGAAACGEARRPSQPAYPALARRDPVAVPHRRQRAAQRRGLGPEGDKLHGRVDTSSAGRGDGTADRGDTVVNGRPSGPRPTSPARVSAFSRSEATRSAPVAAATAGGRRSPCLNASWMIAEPGRWAAGAHELRQSSRHPQAQAPVVPMARALRERHAGQTAHTALAPGR